MSAGAAVAGLLLLAIYPAAVARATKDHGPLVFALFFLAFLLLTHLSVAAIFSEVSLIRSSLSLALIFLLGFAALVFSQVLRDAEPETVVRSVSRVFILLTIALIVGILEIIPGELFGKNKLVFPFAEPSHFSLAFAPFLLFIVLRSSRRSRLLLILIALILAYLLHNFTLILACLLIALVALRTGLLTLLVAALLLGALAVDTTYFTARIVLGGDSDNLSSLVYLQGWQLMGESLGRSGLFGLGFQQLGAVSTSVEAADIIYAISGLEMNRIDGGFLSAKIVSEFGLMGILLVAALLCAALHSALGLRGVNTGNWSTYDPGSVFAHCVVACNPIELLVRGTGYFSGTTMMLMAALFYLFSRPRTAAEKTQQRSIPMGSTPSSMGRVIP